MGDNTGIPRSEYPDALKEVERTHCALNLVFTFLSSRQVVTTFDSIKPLVEAHIKRPLGIEDVAAVVAIRPEAVNFGYVSEAKLQGDDEGLGRDVLSENTELKAESPVTDLSGRDTPGSGRKDGSTGEDSHSHRGKVVLHFEFTDGDLKRAAQPKPRPNGRSSGVKKNALLKVPAHGHAQMASVIERRNKKFSGCLKAFVEKCTETKTDPTQSLKQEAKQYIPAPSSLPTREDTVDHSLNVPQTRGSIPEILADLRLAPWYAGQIVPESHTVFEPRESVYGDLNFPLSQNLVNALYNGHDIVRFYAHQAEALNALHSGTNVVVSTSTGSGKSLIYQVPVLHALEQDPFARAMYIFPTKALAQDQNRSLHELLSYMRGLEQVLVSTFDGDTPSSDRRQICEEARVIFTNPDMLHVTILPGEHKWRSFFQNLKYVVVDELHMYNGQLGAHMAFIMRRLRRICVALGNQDVRFISCSATVANPLEHFRTVFGVDDVSLVDSDGSPRGRKEFLCWNTPFYEPGDPTSGRANTLLECARLFCQLLLRGLRIITFCKTRVRCELLISAIRDELKSLGKRQYSDKVMSYRGGYTFKDRRQIEADMFEGRLLGIVATTALELGIDIGTLDCVLTWGFPYTVANLRQQGGRAGRRRKDSLAILLADALPADQYYMQNSKEIFSRPNTQLQIDLESIVTREAHIQCAAFEMPIQPDEDKAYFGDDLLLLCQRHLMKDEQGFYHCHSRFRPFPSHFVPIRDVEDEALALIDVTNGRNTVLEELEMSRAVYTIHDGAVFLHQGTKYLVHDFQPEKHRALLQRINVDWITRPRHSTFIDPVEVEAVRNLAGPSQVYYGSLRITQRVFGYFKTDRAGRPLDAVDVDNPSTVRTSKGFWMDVPQAALDTIEHRGLDLAAAIHAAEHAIVSLTPTLVVSTPGDLITNCKGVKKKFPKDEASAKPRRRLIFYNGTASVTGSGISAKVFEHIDHLLPHALERVQGCRCLNGCVECVDSEFCQEGNDSIEKSGAVAILRALLGSQVDA